MSKEPQSVEIIRATALQATVQIDGLAALLCDAVDHGASVSFLPPLAPDKARGFWRGVCDAVGRNQCVLLLARLEREIVGTVHLQLASQPNQPHRAEVSKLLVKRGLRRQGVGRILMRRIEQEAKAIGRNLLTLDTRVGDAAEPLYRSLGYVHVGNIPAYALNGQGKKDATAIFYKELT